MSTQKKRGRKKAKAEPARAPAWYTIAGIKQFTGEVRAEFNKVVWPDRKVTMGLTWFVLVLVTLISFYLGAVDLILGNLVTTFIRG